MESSWIFSQEFSWYNFLLLTFLMQLLKGFGHVLRFLAGIGTGYKSVRITGFHTKSCRTHSLRFQPLDMRSIGKLHYFLVFNFSSFLLWIFIPNILGNCNWLCSIISSLIHTFPFGIKNLFRQIFDMLVDDFLLKIDL